MALQDDIQITDRLDDIEKDIKNIQDELQNIDRLDDAEKDIKDIQSDLEECKDLKGQMQVLNERTQTLVTKATKSENAIYGTNGSPGMQARQK